MYYPCFKSSLFVFFLFLIPLVFFSCEKEEDYPAPYIPPKETVIVYMAADNDLSNAAFDNINEMEAAFTGEDKNLLVFMDLGFEQSHVIKITHDETDEVISPTIFSYRNQNSANPDVLQMVIEDITTLYPSSESYGLILWSHGTGWLPALETTKTKSFGRDGRSEMDIKDLEKALPDNTFDYIIFDACLMGSVEVAYQIRHKTSYVLASPTEILARGFPYENIIAPLFDQNENTQQRLESIASEYMDYYKSESGRRQSASMSLIKTDALDRLASITRQLLNSYGLQKWDYKHNYTQRLDVLESPLTFDFRDFLYNNYSDAALAAIDQQLSSTVLYKAHTEEFIGIYSINNFCGLSCYIPQAKEIELNEYYQTLDWCKDSGFELLF